MILCSHVHPGLVIPVCLDDGTNNQKLIGDDLYKGNRIARARGEANNSFVEELIQLLTRRFPSAISDPAARPLLRRYKNHLNCINDDIQGTGAVVMTSLSGGLKYTSRELTDSEIVIYCAGPAGLGLADQIMNHTVAHGAAREEARSKIHALDIRGLIKKSIKEISSTDQHLYADDDAFCEGVDTTSFSAVVKKIKSTCLTDCSTQAGALTQQIVDEMHKHNPRPDIFPLWREALERKLH
jgi:malate dehydrogenase (oxaloacetate-decarboxylating)